MKLYHRSDSIEAGIDEAGRGCLLGRVYAAAVIWPQENDDDYEHPIMKDSKRFSSTSVFDFVLVQRIIVLQIGTAFFLS